MKKIRHASRFILVVALAYGLAWLLSFTLGRTQVRSAVSRDLRVQLDSNVRSLRRADSLHSRVRSGIGTINPSLDIAAMSPVPFLVRVRYRAYIHAAYAWGGTTWYLWAFGAHVRLTDRLDWIS